MSLRQMLRWWLGLLRPTTIALSVSDPPAAPVAYQYRSIEALMLLPTVTPERAGYLRPDLGDIDALMTWMVYERSAGWWRVPTHDVRDAAEAGLRMRARLHGKAVRP